MRKKIFAAMMFATVVAASAQTQMANSDFEEWTSTSKGSAVPKEWHSFSDADCQLKGIYSWGCSFMQTNHSSRVSGHGGYGCEIEASTIAATALVNGVITTGQMVFASTSTKSEENHTYSDIANRCGHGAAMHFTGLPDSVYFWCRFDMKKRGNTAVAKFHLHTATEYKDIPTHRASTPQPGKVGNAFCEMTDPGDGLWHRYGFGFTYYDENSGTTTANGRKPQYILASFSTNKIAKGGNSGDNLAIDEIRMVYNKRLSLLEIDGKPVEGFNPDRGEYMIEWADRETVPQVTAKAQSGNATVEVDSSDFLNSGTIRIVVSHDDGCNVYTLRQGSENAIAQKSEPNMQ